MSLVRSLSPSPSISSHQLTLFIFLLIPQIENNHSLPTDLRTKQRERKKKRKRNKQGQRRRVLFPFDESKPAGSISSASSLPPRLLPSQLPPVHYPFSLSFSPLSLCVSLPALPCSRFISLTFLVSFRSSSANDTTTTEALNTVVGSVNLSTLARSSINTSVTTSIPLRLCVS